MFVYLSMSCLFRCWMVKDSRSSTMRFVCGGGKNSFESCHRADANLITVRYAFHLVLVSLESNCKQEALGNQVSGAHLICYKICHKSLAESESGRGTKRENWQCWRQILGVCLLALGTAPSPGSKFPGKNATCLTTLSHLTFVTHFPVVCRNRHHNWGVNWEILNTIKFFETKENLAWAVVVVFFKTIGEIRKLMRNLNSGKREHTSQQSQKTLGLAAFPSF